MRDSFQSLFGDSHDPLRWDQQSWSAGEAGLHIVSDFATFIAYVGILVTLFVYVRRRGPGIAFPKVSWLFAAFVLICGGVHLIEAVISWFPIYSGYPSGLLKLVTAVASLGMLFAVFRITLEALEMPSVIAVNQELKLEIERRAKVEERLTAILDSMSDGVLVSDNVGNIELINPAAEAILQLDEEEREYSKRFENYQIYDANGFTPFEADEQPLRRAARGENVDNSEILIICPAKNIHVSLLIRGRPITSDAGGPAGAVIVFHDISELKLAEQDRNLQMQRLERMTDSAARVTQAMQESSAEEAGYLRVIGEVFGCKTVMLAMCNEDGISVRKYRFGDFAGSEPEKTTFQAQAGSLVGPECEELIDHAMNLEQAPAFDSAVRNIGIGGLPMDGVVRGALLICDREELFTADELDLLKRIARLISSAVFTRARVEAEEKARQVAESKLAASRKQLARVTQVNSLGEMTAGIAHELNQPLTALINYTDAALQLVSSDLTSNAMEDLRQMTRRANDQAIRAAGVLRSVRSIVSRGEIDFKPVNVLTLMKSCCRLLEDEIQMAEASVSISEDSADFELMGDSVQLEQLFVNLIQNAVNAVTGHARREIELFAVREIRYARIEILDLGKGFVDDENERLFDAFYTTRESGLGLGLKICRSIVETHGGNIQAASREGGGAKFTIILPLKQRDQKKSLS